MYTPNDPEVIGLEQEKERSVANTRNIKATADDEGLLPTIKCTCINTTCEACHHGRNSARPAGFTRITSTWLALISALVIATVVLTLYVGVAPQIRLGKTNLEPLSPAADAATRSSETRSGSGGHEASEGVFYEWPQAHRPSHDSWYEKYRVETEQEELLMCKKTEKSGLWGFFKQHNSTTVESDNGPREWAHDSACKQVEIARGVYIECDEKAEPYFMLCNGNSANETLLRDHGDPAQGCETAEVVMSLPEQEVGEESIDEAHALCKAINEASDEGHARCQRGLWNTNRVQ